MTMIKTSYDPDSPRDISDFLMALGELWTNRDNGPARATRAIEEMAKQGPEGRQLLLNCHLVISRQIHQVRERDILNMMMSLQQITGALARGGR